MTTEGGGMTAHQSEDLAAVDNRGEAVHGSYDEWWCPTDERWVLDPGPCPDGSTHEPRAGMASPSLRRRAMAEDFDRERLGRRATFGLASFSPVVRGWARDLASALSEVERLREALSEAAADLDEEHQPTWSSDEAAAKGKAPIGCALCWPGDGHWPCSSRLIADDLRAALSGSKEDDRG